MAGQPPSGAAITARLITCAELTEGERQQWLALCAAHPDYDSALLRPEFAQIISQFRPDVRLVLIGRGDRLVAVLAVHLRPDGLARPLGAPFADYSGPVIAEDFPLQLEDMLDGAGIAAYASSTMLDPWNRFETLSQARSEDESHVIRPGSLSLAEYMETRRSLHPKRFKNFRRLKNQIERDVGAIRLEWGRPTSAAYATMMALKRAQFRQSGLVDLTSATLSRQLLDEIALREEGFAVMLWSGARLISMHFGVKIDTAFHPWIAVFDPDLSAYSPGILLLNEALENLQKMGIGTYDLASGHDHYKKYFSNASRPVRNVFVAGSDTRALRHRLNRKVWVLAGANKPDSPAARLRRRMNHIAASESHPALRVREFGYAILERLIRRKKH